MYSAKSGTPGTYAVYEPAMHAEALRRLDARTTESLSTEHPSAADRQPTPHGQPESDTRDSLATGVAAQAAFSAVRAQQALLVRVLLATTCLP